MAAADVETVPIYIRRTPTCMSLQQNAETYQQPAKGDGHTLGCIPQPDAAVMDARGACIPKFSFPALDCKLHAPQKRVRSFGDLHQALVPDMDDGSEDCCGCPPSPCFCPSPAQYCSGCLGLLSLLAWSALAIHAIYLLRAFACKWSGWTCVPASAVVSVLSVV